MSESLLEATGVKAAYGQVNVLHGIDFAVNEGEVVVILGANGAGKTTTLRSISAMRLVTVQGSIKVAGAETVGKNPADVVRMGVAHVPQGRGTFPELSVEDNLHSGAYVIKDRSQIQEDIERYFDMFPVLRERRDQLAGSLSGGEQQMLAVSRALMSRPRLLLLDEPSLGLAPLIVEQLFETLAQINRDTGMTMLVVEQNAQLALSIANRAYVLEAGQIVLSGDAESMKTDEAVRQAYLGY